MTTAANSQGPHVPVCEHMGAISHANGEATPLVLVLGTPWGPLFLPHTLVSAFALPTFLSFLLLYSSGLHAHPSSRERTSERHPGFFCGRECLTHLLTHH